MERAEGSGHAAAQSPEGAKPKLCREAGVQQMKPSEP